MSGLRRLRVRELHPNLLCILCGGYYVDATTIVECLHSFCKTCIVRYLESSKFCPICDVQVHKTKPLLSIRPDKTLQDIVYKLVPGLYPNEMCKRREFYTSHPESIPATPEGGGSDLGRYYTLPDDPVSLALSPASSCASTSPSSPPHNPEYRNHVHLPSSPAKMTRSYHQRSVESRVRYLQCPAGVSVAQLKRLIRAKFGVGPAHPMALLTTASEDPLHDAFTLVDVAYITSWQRTEPLHLLYRIYEKASKKIKLDPEVCVTDTDTHNSCEDMPKLEPSVGNGAPVCMPPEDTGDYSTAPLLQAMGAITSVAERRSCKGGVSKALGQPGRPSEGPATAHQGSPSAKVSRAVGVMEAPPRDSPVIQNCDSLLGLTQGMGGVGSGRVGAVEPVVRYPGVFAAPGNGVSVGVALVPGELGLLAPTNVTCAIIPGAASLPVLCGAGGEWGVTGPQVGAQVIAPLPPLPPTAPPPPPPAAAAAAAAGKRGPQVPREAEGSCKNGVSGGGEEGGEVQLKISESGVMSVCGKDTTVEGVLNSLESEAGELLSKIESGSLGEEFPSVPCPKNSDRKRAKTKAWPGQGKVATKPEDRGDKCQLLHKSDRTLALPGKAAEVDSRRPVGGTSRRDSSETANTTTTTTTITTTTTTSTGTMTGVPMEGSREQSSMNGEPGKATVSVDGILPDTNAPEEQPNSCKEAKEEGSKSSRASHIPASLAAASMANLNKPLLKAGSSKVQPVEDKNKEQKLSNNGLSTKKEVRSPAGGGASTAGGGGCRRGSHSFGYKTLKTPPKSWNPTISREHLAAGKSQAGKGPNDPPRPNKFFKARNRTASAEAQGGGGSPRHGAGMVLKIDPKTLGPISATVRGDAGAALTSQLPQSPVLPLPPQVTTPQGSAMAVTPVQERGVGVRGETPAAVTDTVQASPVVKKDAAPSLVPTASDGKESTNHSAKVVGTTIIQDNNTLIKTNNVNITNNNNNSNSNNNNNSNDNNNSSSKSNSHDNNTNTNNSKSSKSGKSLDSSGSVDASRNVRIQSAQTQTNVGKFEANIASRTDKGGSKAAGIGVATTTNATASTSHSTQLKLAPCSTPCLTPQIPVNTVSTLTLPQLQPQPLAHTHTQHQSLPISQHQHQPQLHPNLQHQSQPQLQIQPHSQPQFQLQTQHQSQLQLQSQIQTQPQQQLAIGSQAIGIIPSSGVSFTGAIGTLPLPYYTSPPLGYPTYPYFYQTPEAIGLMSPHSFFSPCLPPRSPLSSRNVGGPKMMPDLPLQLPMMPIVSQGPNQALSPRPMTPPSPRTSTPTQPPRPYPPHSPRQLCTNPSSRPHTPQSPKCLVPAQSPKLLATSQSPKPLPGQSPNPLVPTQSCKPLTQSPKALVPPQSPKALAPSQSQSPKPIAPAQSPRPYTQSPKPYSPSLSPKHPTQVQSPKPPGPAQSPKPLAPPQSPKALPPPLSPKPPTPSQSPKPPSRTQSPMLTSQSPKPTTSVQSPMTPARVQSPMPPAPSQSPKPPSRTQSPMSLQSPMTPARVQSPMPPTPALSFMPPISLQSPMPPISVQSPMPPTSVQSMPSALTQSPMPPTSIQSPMPPTPAQSFMPPISLQSPMPPAQTQSPISVQSPMPPTSVQSPMPPTPAQSFMPPISLQSPMPPAQTQSPMSPISLQSPMPPTPAQSFMPPISLQSPMPPISLQSPMPPTSLQSPMPPTSLQSPMPPAPAQSYMPPISLQSPMPPISLQSPMPHTSVQSPMPSASAQSPMPPALSGQSVRPQIQSPKQFSVAQSVATQPQPPKDNTTATPARHATPCTTQLTYAGKMAPLPQQASPSLKSWPQFCSSFSSSQSAMPSSSGSSFCPQNPIGKLNVFSQTPATQPSATTKAAGNSFDFSKSVLPQPPKSVVNDQLSSCNVMPTTAGCLQSTVSFPSQTFKPATPYVFQSQPIINSVPVFGSQVTGKVSQLDAQMVYQGSPSGSRPEFRKTTTDTERSRESKLNHHNRSDGTISTPSMASMPLMASSVFPGISVANKGLSLAPATTFCSGYYPHGLHLSLASSGSPTTYTDSIKTSPLTSLAGALVASTTLAMSTLPFSTTSLVSQPMSLANMATVTTIPSFASCPVLSAPGGSPGTAPSPSLAIGSAFPAPRVSAYPVPASADTNKKTAHAVNATDRLPSVEPSSGSSVVNTVPNTTTVAVTVSINATSNAITPVNTLATSSITNAEALLPCCTALATLPVISSAPTVAGSSNMTLCTAASVAQAPLSSVVCDAGPEKSTAALLQRNMCSSGVPVSSVVDTATAIVGARTPLVTACTGQNTQRGSSAATVTPERGSGGGGGGGGGPAAAGPEKSCVTPVQPLPASMPVSSSTTSTTCNSSSSASASSNTSASSSSSVTTTAVASSAAASGSCRGSAPLLARKEASLQVSGCPSPRSSAGEHSVVNVMESGGREPQSSACTPVCDVTHVIDAKQQCAEPSVSSSGGPRPCLKS